MRPLTAARPTGDPAMASFLKIGHSFLNLDRIQRVEDRYASDKEDTLVVRFGAGEAETLTISGQEADDLRTWLNSVATNLRSASGLESGR
jgi:hypothetical protein